MNFYFILTYRSQIVENTATVGLILTSFVQLSSYLCYICYALGVLSANINVVERIQRWIKQKDFEDQSPNQVTSEWPTEGKIQIERLNIRYREGLPLVIRRMNLSVKPGEKVGILGRTGSGKSTLVLALLRILEIEEEEHDLYGTIKIDGVNIKKVSLETLRRNVVTIPQDPYLLEGSMKFNIDPLGLHSGREVVESLKKVNFFSSLSEDNDNIEENNRNRPLEETELIENFKIEAKGSNLSLGQRQLICIARALIQKPKILVTDEATASIDLRTDQLVQELIKTELRDTTVLTIAHRLNTIIEYDKIVVLKKGKKVEEGSPYELLRSPGYFYEFVEEGGEDYLRMMTERAKLVHKNKF